MNLGNESETVEFKKSTSELKEGVLSIAAILNKHGHGDLFFGVKNNGDVCGMQVSDATLREIGQTIDQSIEPRIHPTILRLGDENGNEYVRVSFAGIDGPYSCKGIYKLRVSDSDVNMSPAEVRRRAAQSYMAEHPWDHETNDTPLNKIEEPTIKKYLSRGAECGRITFEYAGIEDALQRLGLMENGKLTNAATILFCKPKTIMLKMAIFATDARINILDMHQEQDNLFALAKIAEEFIMRNIKWRFLIEGSMQREELPEIPQAAIREGVINAFCHRDYTSTLAVQVDIFPEKIEIFNPGHFPQEIRPECLLELNEFPISKSPNQLIAQTLYRSKDIESYGTGIRRIQKLCAEKNITFEYDTNEHGTILRFHRPNWLEESMNSRNEIPARVSNNKQIALEIARKTGQVTVKELSQQANIGRATARKVLKKLEKEGSLIWEGRSTSGPRQRYLLHKE